MPPLLGRQTAALDVGTAEARLGHDESHHQLHGRHLQREEGYGSFVIDGHVARHRQHECRLSHRGTRRNDDQIGGLPSQRHAVDGHESRRHAVEGARILARLLDLRQSLGQNILGILHRTLDMPLRDLEYLALGKTYQIRHILILVVGAALDLRGRAYQLALDIFLGYDLGMELDVGRRPDLLRQLREICRPAHLLELLAGLQAFGYGIEVYGLEFGRERLDGLVYESVLLGVEGVGRDILLHGDDAVLLQHERSEHRLLKLHGLRRHDTRNRSIGHLLVSGPVGGRRSKFLCHKKGVIFKFQNYTISAERQGLFPYFAPRLPPEAAVTASRPVVCAARPASQRSDAHPRSPP